MKPLSLRIAERVIKTASPNSPLAHRAVVIINRAEIQEAILRGCSLLSIWQILREEGVVNFGYQAFSRHTRSTVRLPENCSEVNTEPPPTERSPLC